MKISVGIEAEKGEISEQPRLILQNRSAASLPAFEILTRKRKF